MDMSTDNVLPRRRYQRRGSVTEHTLRAAAQQQMLLVGSDNQEGRPFLEQQHPDSEHVAFATSSSFACTTISDDDTRNQQQEYIMKRIPLDCQTNGIARGNLKDDGSGSISSSSSPSSCTGLKPLGGNQRINNSSKVCQQFETKPDKFSLMTKSKSSISAAKRIKRMIAVEISHETEDFLMKDRSLSGSGSGSSISSTSTGPKQLLLGDDENIYYQRKSSLGSTNSSLSSSRRHQADGDDEMTLEEEYQQMKISSPDDEIGKETQKECNTASRENTANEVPCSECGHKRSSWENDPDAHVANGHFCSGCSYFTPDQPWSSSTSNDMPPLYGYCFCREWDNAIARAKKCSEEEVTYRDRHLSIGCPALHWASYYNAPIELFDILLKRDPKAACLSAISSIDEGPVIDAPIWTTLSNGPLTQYKVDIIELMLRYCPEAIYTVSEDGMRESVLCDVFESFEVHFQKAADQEVMDDEDRFVVLQHSDDDDNEEDVALAWKLACLLLKVADTGSVSYDEEWKVVHACARCKDPYWDPVGFMNLAMFLYPDQVKQDVYGQNQGQLPLHVAIETIRDPRQRYDPNEPYESDLDEIYSNDEERLDPDLEESNEKKVEIDMFCEAYPEAACIPNYDGTLPLNMALHKRKTWFGGIQGIVNANPAALTSPDKETQLYPFMLAAVVDPEDTSCCQTSLNTIYELLRLCPELERFGGWKFGDANFDDEEEEEDEERNNDKNNNAGKKRKIQDTSSICNDSKDGGADSDDDQNFYTYTSDGVTQNVSDSQTHYLQENLTMMTISLSEKTASQEGDRNGEAHVQDSSNVTDETKSGLCCLATSPMKETANSSDEPSDDNNSVTFPKRMKRIASQEIVPYCNDDLFNKKFQQISFKSKEEASAFEIPCNECGQLRSSWEADSDAHVANGIFCSGCGYFNESPPWTLSSDQVPPLYGYCFCREWDNVVARAKKCTDEEATYRDRYFCLGCPALHWASNYNAPLEVLEALLQRDPQSARLSAIFSIDGPIIDAPIWTTLSNGPLTQYKVDAIKLMLQYCPEAIYTVSEEGTRESILCDVSETYEELFQQVADKVAANEPDAFTTVQDSGSDEVDVSLAWNLTCLLLKVADTGCVSRDDEWKVVHACARCKDPYWDPLGFMNLAMVLYPEQAIGRVSEEGRLPLHVAIEATRDSRKKYDPVDPPEDYDTDLLTNDEEGLDPDLEESTEKKVEIELLCDFYPDAAFIADSNGSLPLCLALNRGKTWYGGIQDIVNSNPAALTVRDKTTKLFPFMLAAISIDDTLQDFCSEHDASTHRHSCCRTSLNTIYELLRSCPELERFGKWNATSKNNR